VSNRAAALAHHPDQARLIFSATQKHPEIAAKQPGPERIDML